MLLIIHWCCPHVLPVLSGVLSTIQRQHTLVHNRYYHVCVSMPSVSPAIIVHLMSLAAAIGQPQ